MSACREAAAKVVEAVPGIEMVRRSEFASAFGLVRRRNPPYYHLLLFHFSASRQEAERVLC